ncbi:MAG: cytochrome c [Bradyrhizobium sp.]|uniref:cytochrome c n=1 Tax=Bradyrhizobium sp. TaxID=376 RepID=UPI001C29565A|nr:cytochrome c [Bradyrhizobium sp.]MBU6464106.1 c-type cytochrome [Pseudomonadota bacterium]MDE2069123.1 cytochrome c [Bradyrhizobium sp.]MDE2244493.1 cytochrome c [Bradyrhizobium sp.]MDE2469566.1 cytochrome c [Bradyrhizobium sp.]
MRAILLILFLCTAFVCGDAHGQSPSADKLSAETIERGKALTDAGGCAGCHTSDPAKPFAGGKRIVTSIGAIYSSNLTPDRDTGIGAWSDQDFRRALREGVAPDGSGYYPVFPYPYFTRLTRDDIQAIRAYLATLTPVHNPIPSPELRWPLNYRVLLRGWDWLFFKPGILQPDQQKSTEWNRGHYLVAGPGHCGACHTPKNVFGAERRTHALGGGLVQDQFAPRLDAAEHSGLKSWSVDDIVEYLQSGRNGRSHASGLMADIVRDSTSIMSDADIRAIAIYLKDLPPGEREPNALPPPPAQMSDGEKVYKGSCVTCHEADGSGSPRIYPPLPGNANLQSAIAASTLRIILDGAQTLTTPRAPNPGSMPAYADKLSDQEIADVTTYIRNSWGNSASAVTAAQVAKARK